MLDGIRKGRNGETTVQASAELFQDLKGQFTVWYTPEEGVLIKKEASIEFDASRVTALDD